MGYGALQPLYSREIPDHFVLIFDAEEDTKRTSGEVDGRMEKRTRHPKSLRSLACEVKRKSSSDPNIDLKVKKSLIAMNKTCRTDSRIALQVLTFKRFPQKALHS